MASRFSVEAVFKAVDRITAPVTRMQNRVGKFARTSRRAFDKLNRSVDRFSAGIKKGFARASVAVVGFGFAMLDVIGIGASFGRAIGAAAAKFPEDIQRGTAAFRALEDAARDVGRTTEFSATQAANGLNFLAKAGFSAEFSTKALAKIVDFATASELDFATAADIASDSLGAFGLNSDNLDDKMRGLVRVMDVMSSAANSTNLSVSELFESVKDGAAISTTAGVSIETFAATMGFLANSGIKASKAGTAAKNITLALAGVGNQAAKVFERLGIKLASNTGELRDQFDILDDLRAKLGQFGQKQKVEIIEAIFGKIPIASASLLLTKAGKSVRVLRAELEKAGGSSKRTAAFIRNDVKGSLDSLQSAIESVKISIFSLNEGPLKGAIDQMTAWIGANEDLIATKVGGFLLNLITNFEKIVSVGKQIAGVMLAFIALSAALKVAAGVMLAFNLVTGAMGLAVGLANGAVLIYAATIAGLPAALALARVAMLALNIAFTANPIGLIITAIGLFIGLAAIVITAWEPVTKFFSDLADKISLVASGIGGTLRDFGDFFGFGDDAQPASASAQVVSPQARVARSIEEQRTTSTAEVTIRDETGRAEVTQGTLGPGLKLEQTGAF